jgi:MFS family permease
MTKNEKRWLRIIPVALIMYTISYIDRTNISLALDPKLSSMMRDLLMDDEMKGRAAGIFFLGYVLLQIPGGHLAGHWSAKKLISVLLVCWGICAVGCGLVSTFRQFEVMRFLLGMAESGVFPATLVLIAHWFPKAERARANAYWSLCQPLAIVASANITSQLLHSYGWQKMLMFEGALPFIWLPIWLIFINDHPKDAKWISPEEKEYLETTLRREASEREPEQTASLWAAVLCWETVIMVAMNFMHNAQAYGCMTFFTSTLEGRGFSAAQYGILFAIPYAVTAVIMLLNSRHSDKTGERRGHVAFVYTLSGATLIGSVLLKEHFWPSYALMCLAIQGPFAALGPFWAIPGETLPRKLIGPVIGLVNALGNVGGFAGPYFVGWLKKHHGGVTLPFSLLGAGMLLAAALAFLLPKTKKNASEVVAK